MDDAAAQRNAAQLDELVEDTSALSATLKRRIKALEKQGGSGRDAQIRKQQVGAAMSLLGLSLSIGCRRRSSSQNSSRPSKTTRPWNSNTEQNISNAWRGNSRSVGHLFHDSTLD
jgi:hypothetical protein